MIELAPDERPKVQAWFVMWACLCSDVRVKAADLPAQCPGHGRDRVAKPERLDALVEFVDVHECGQPPCVVLP